jgi:hypothetical protein
VSVASDILRTVVNLGWVGVEMRVERERERNDERAKQLSDDSVSVMCTMLLSTP